MIEKIVLSEEDKIRLTNAKTEIFNSLHHYVRNVYPVDIEFIRECSNIHYSITCILSHDLVESFKKRKKDLYKIDSDYR